MRKRSKKILIILSIFSLFLAGYFLFPRKKADTEKQIPIQNNNTPSQTNLEVSQVPNSEEKTEENTSKLNNEEGLETEKKSTQNIPEKHLLDIPFYSQAPLLKWDAFHEDMCEEASVLNAALFLDGKKITSDQFEAELQKMQKIEKNELGKWKSTTVVETKKIVDDFFDEAIKSRVIDNPSVSEIEAEIADGHPVVVPLAGRDIGNPNFTPPGPVYHMLVIKGYDAVNFITNDVGTRKGNSYVYKKEVIMKNMHDWNKEDIHLGERRVLALYK